ncbi:hypothetical protein RQP46_008958 [Phenoliferia psychrophenolica]
MPDEILVMIGREVAPKGGRKAGNLRLANRHFDKVVAPIVMSSIVFSSSTANLDDLCVDLMDKRVERRAVTSVRFNIPATQTVLPLRVLAKLPNLQRLHIYGSLGSEKIHAEMCPLLHSVVALHLERIDLTDRYDLKELAARVEDLKITDCQDSEGLFIRMKDGTPQYTALPKNLRSVAYRPSSSLSGATLQRAINTLLVDIVGSRTVKYVKIHWILIEPITSHEYLIDKGSFAVDHRFGDLVLPDLEELSLVNSCPGTMDMLHVSNFTNYVGLADLFVLLDLPRLFSLRLIGWFDKTGVEALSQLTMGEFPTDHPFLYSLLGVLAEEQVYELRLENSKGHADATSLCIFTRMAGNEWQSRLVHA